MSMNKTVEQTKSNHKDYAQYPAQQVSGVDAKGQYILSVLVKRTYRIDKTGLCHNDIEELPLVEDLAYYPESEDQLLESDFDIYPLKSKTDVIIKGYAQAGKASKYFSIGINIGKHRTSISVIGNRKAFLNASNKVLFSEPELIDRVPLRYDFAYGGWDKIGEYIREVHSQERIKMIPDDIDWPKGSGYRYPRNPLGKGYLVDLNRDAVEQLELPNLEDPLDRLKPDHLAADDWKRWPEMPVPRCTDWMDVLWFPRYAHFGFNVTALPSSKPAVEVARGWTRPDILEDKNAEQKFSYQAFNGASMGLQLDFLKGNEQCNLHNIHPEMRDFRFKLPGDVPKIWVDGRKGKLKETNPVLHTLVIEPEENRLSMVWRGSAPALRPYLENELNDMPFKVTWE